MVTKNVRYALRMVIRLAISGEPLSSKELASSEHITPRFALKLLFYLRNAGILRSIRGRHGGYVLAKDPSEISLADIFEVFGTSTDIVDCRPSCALYKKCYAKDFWYCLNTLLDKIFTQTTIAHVIENRCPEELKVLSLEPLKSKRVPSPEK